MLWKEVEGISFNNNLEIILGGYFNDIIFELENGNLRETKQLLCYYFVLFQFLCDWVLYCLDARFLTKYWYLVCSLLKVPLCPQIDSLGHYNLHLWCLFQFFRVAINSMLQFFGIQGLNFEFMKGYVAHNCFEDLAQPLIGFIRDSNLNCQVVIIVKKILSR